MAHALHLSSLLDYEIPIMVYYRFMDVQQQGRYKLAVKCCLPFPVDQLHAVINDVIYF